MLNKKRDTNRWSLEEADALDRAAVLRTSAAESARYVRRLGATFLLFAFYVAVIVFSTTDEQLLKETGARLPLLNAELPLFGFAIFIPWLVLTFHIHLISQLFLLSRKLHNLNQVIIIIPEEIARTYSELFFPLAFSHTIVDRRHPGLLRWVFSAAVVITVVIVPMALLLAIQWKFLPYHQSWITLDHQIVFVLDLFLLWTFWPRLTARSGQWRVRWPCRGREGERTYILWPRTKRQSRQMLRVFAAGASTIVVFVVSVLLLVPPGDGIERVLGEQAWLDTLHRNLNLQNKTLVRTAPPPELIAAYKATGEPPEKVWLDHGKPLDLQYRDLRNANFSRTTLWNVDLRGVELQGANLLRANLQGATLERANLQGVNFKKAQLQGADLRRAQLQGANLRKAQLQGANLRRAQLQGANLVKAQLQGVDLGEAQVQGVDLAEAQLQGANLKRAWLQGAYLSKANLQGTILGEAQLQGANLVGSQLQGADLREARIYANEFAQADLSLADFRGLVSAPIDWDVISSLFETMGHLESSLISSAENSSDLTPKYAQAALSRFWDIAFELPLDRNLPAPSQATGALYDHCGLFADWPPPPIVSAFEAKHIAFLADFSCDDRNIARAIVTRALYPKPSLALAQALLNKAASNKCPDLAGVVEINRKQLKHLTQQTQQPSAIDFDGPDVDAIVP